jgi:hypothetical protein
VRSSTRQSLDRITNSQQEKIMKLAKLKCIAAMVVAIGLVLGVGVTQSAQARLSPYSSQARRAFLNLFCISFNVSGLSPVLKVIL